MTAGGNPARVSSGERRAGRPSGVRTCQPGHVLVCRAAAQPEQQPRARRTRRGWRAHRPRGTARAHPARRPRTAAAAGASRKPAWATDDQASIPTASRCRSAPTLPIVMVTAATTATSGCHVSVCRGQRIGEQDQQRHRVTRPWTPPRGSRQPSRRRHRYASGIHTWNGTAPSLNSKPTTVSTTATAMTPSGHVGARERVLHLGVVERARDAVEQ